MKTQTSLRNRGFTLIETVIAIGVLAVLLTGFIIVFAPAAAGIKKSINIQDADRLASTIEQELVTLRKGDAETTGFNKAFDRIAKSNAGSATNALLVYQYRGNPDPNSFRTDGTPIPVVDATKNIPGKDYIVQSMVRRKNDTKFTEDLKAIVGGVYAVKCTQLVFKNSELALGTAGQIVDPKNSGTTVASADAYPEAVIAFSAQFFALPAKSETYFTNTFTDNAFNKLKSPVFTRNLAVRR